MVVFAIFDDPSPSDPLWNEWRNLVNDEEWNADDRSVTTLTPTLHSTRSVFAKTKDGCFIGAVVWNEYENLAWIGFYLLKEEYRGRGIGSQIWEKAISRINQNVCTIGLRGVPNMAPRYKIRDTPFERDTISKYTGHWKIFQGIAEQNETQDATKRIRSIREIPLDEMELYDKHVTGRDRSDFISRIVKLPFVEGYCLYDENNQITAMALLTPTGHEKEKLFKLAPIYASTLQDAMTVAKPLIEKVGEKCGEGRIMLNIMDNIGKHRFEPLLLEEKQIIRTEDAGRTLFSKPFEELFKKELIFVPNNNSCHYDC